MLQPQNRIASWSSDASAKQRRNRGCRLAITQNSEDSRCQLDQVLQSTSRQIRRITNCAREVIEWFCLYGKSVATSKTGLGSARQRNRAACDCKLFRILRQSSSNGYSRRESFALKTVLEIIDKSTMAAEPRELQKQSTRLPTEYAQFG